MLRQWHRSSHASYLAEQVVHEDDDEDIPLWDGGGSDTRPAIKNSVANRKELENLLKEFSDVLKMSQVAQPLLSTLWRLAMLL